MGPGTIALNGSLPAAQLGRTVTVANSNGQSRRLKVVAVLDRNSIDAAQLGSYVDARTFRSVVGDKAPTVAFMDVKDGAQSETKDAINDLADTRPDVTATEGNALGRLLGSIFDFLIKAVDGLLMMSVIIALIGIVNTLSLAIIERRRELGLLRVVGMTDDLVQRMVRIESLLIAALGTLTGVVLGLFAGWAPDPCDRPPHRRLAELQRALRHHRARPGARRRARRARLAAALAPLDSPRHTRRAADNLTHMTCHHVTSHNSMLIGG